MAEDKFNSNTRSPRFSTTKALGFRGGSINSQTGNLQQPSYLQTAGINTAPQKPQEPPAAAAERNVNPAISQFSAPKPASLGSTLAMSAGSAVAGEAAKQGISKAGNAIGSAVSNYFKPSGIQIAPSGEGFYSSGTLNQSFPGTPNMSMDPSLAGTKTFAGEYGITPTTTPDFLQNAADVNAAGDSWDYMGGAADTAFAGDAASYGTDIGASFADTADLADAAAGFDAAGAGADAVGGSIPWVGPAMRLAQGDVGGAAGSAVGGAIGTAIMPGIGTAIGSWLGGTIGGDCFITEAVMSAGGQGDTAPELEALRQFRDQVLSTTPQGQALIQEYTAIAPLVVESVMQRPDSLQIFQQIDSQFVNPAVEAVNQGDFQKALQIYSAMISYVTPFAMEGGEGETMPAGVGGAGDMDAMQEMGEHAAMISHSPEMAGAATGDMGGAGLDQDPTGYDGGPMPQGQSPMMQQFARPRY